MTEKVLLKKSIGNALRDFRFERRGQSWLLQGQDNVVVFNLQKYDFGALYFVNFGVWLQALGTAQYPEEHHCHVRARLERLFPEFRELIFNACTISSDNSDLPYFIDFLRQHFVPFAESCLSTPGLKGNIRSGRIPEQQVYLVAKIALGLIPPTQAPA